VSRVVYAESFQQVVRPISRVHPGVFKTQIDLNALRDAVHESQRRGDAYPSDPSRRVSVTRDAQIVMGEVVDENHTSKVQQGTFAGVPQPSATERQLVRNKLPVQTQWVEAGGIGGWAFPVHTELGDRFDILIYDAGSKWKAILISPTIEGRFNAHNSHLYSDGHICLSDSPGNGQPTLEEAFSKSVLWANGMSIHMKGHPFPFSINNL